VTTIPLLPTFCPRTKGALPHAEAPFESSLDAEEMDPLSVTWKVVVPALFLTTSAPLVAGMVVVVVAEVLVVVTEVLVVVAEVVVVVVAPLHPEQL